MDGVKPQKGMILKMIITAENRNIIKKNEINIHDACFYSFEIKYTDEKYYYTLKAHDEWNLEEEFLFVFSGVSSCMYTGENYSDVLGSYVNSWYSLPSYPYGSLASDSLTKNEITELDQHGIWKNSNIRKNIRVWEHELHSIPKNTLKLFKTVFFFSTPAFLEIECEKLVFEKR